MKRIQTLREQMRMGKSLYDLPLRVTYYARVSTDKLEQQGSLKNQVQYYTEQIQKNRNWIFVEGYVDEGISGTSTEKREDFLRMIADAHCGRFDFIITKEISRFSRIRWTVFVIHRSCWRQGLVFCSKMIISIHSMQIVNFAWWSWLALRKMRCASCQNVSSLDFVSPFAMGACWGMI